MVLKTDIIILLTYLGLQSNQISKRFKSCIDHFFTEVIVWWSLKQIIAESSICQMPKAKFPMTNCKSNLYRFSSELLTHNYFINWSKTQLVPVNKVSTRAIIWPSDIFTFSEIFGYSHHHELFGIVQGESKIMWIFLQKNKKDK